MPHPCRVLGDRMGVLIFPIPESTTRNLRALRLGPGDGVTMLRMPWGLKRFQQARCLHFLTFSCYRRAPLLGTPRSRDIFEQTLERTRHWYGFYVAGYVVMPEHVHLLITEPERAKLSVALQMLKQNVAHQLRGPEGGIFWQPRYYGSALSSSPAPLCGGGATISQNLVQYSTDPAFWSIVLSKSAIVRSLRLDSICRRVAAMTPRSALYSALKKAR